ncbi:hypothetical protein BGY98DRAFT_935899 [Russula aff. rugulosa BPL654]|nr:hypothetical protein BGY98DRAFT_935899 [Russula aff. rugulosa BPL654]
MLLAQPPVVENDIPSHLSHPPVNVHHASTPLIPYVSHGSRLEDGEPEHTTTEHGGCGLEQLAATHAPRILSEEDFALLVRHHNIYGGFRFPSGHAGTGTTANVPPDLGISHIPALPAQQPGMQGPWFSSGFPAPQGSHPALPLPTQQEPLAPSEEMWDDTYLTVLGTQQYDEAACLYYSWSALADRGPVLSSAKLTIFFASGKVGFAFTRLRLRKLLDRGTQNRRKLNSSGVVNQGGCSCLTAADTSTASGMKQTECHKVHGVPHVAI